MPASNATHLQKYSLLLISSLFLFFSCKSLDLSRPGPLPIIPETDSEVSLPLQMPASTLDGLINTQVPQLLISKDAIEWGSGIEGGIQIRRAGKIDWKPIDAERIQLKVPLQIKGEVGLKQSGLGSLFRKKIPIDERFSPILLVNPQINKNWSLSIHDFELLDLGGELKLDVLGVGIDLSGTLKRQISQWARENLGPDKELAQLKPWVDLLWQQVGKPFSVQWQDQSLAFSIRPVQVDFEESFAENDNLDLFLGLKGIIQSHPVDAMPTRAFPLPELNSNSSATNKLSVKIPISIDYEFLDRELANYLGSGLIRVDKKTTMQLSNLQTSPFGERLKVQAEFTAFRSDGEEISGQFILVGIPGFDKSTQRIQLENINFKVLTESAKVKWAVALKKGKIIRRISKQANFPIEELLQSTVNSIQGQLQLQTAIADLKIIDLGLQPSGFYPSQNNLIIHLLAEGLVDLTWK